jgi:hypothetical protein
MEAQGAERFRDELSACLFRTELPQRRTALSDLALLFFFARYDVDVRAGRARLEHRPETP